MSNQFRPMLAGKADLNKIVFPVLASPKLDGVRCIVKDGVCLSRSLTPFPNKRLQLKFGKAELEGYDGELIVGNPWDKNVCDATRSEVMRIDGSCLADFYVFDRWNMIDATYLLRQAHVYPHQSVHLLEQKMINSIAELETYEQEQLDIGYEGVVLRKPDGGYKYGRSTVKEGWLLKVKRFEDSEAQIIGYEELMHNANEAQTSHLGLTKRQTLQENLVGMNTLGALLVRDLHTGVEFKIGTGLSQQQRQEMWNSNKLIGQIVKYKFFPVGVLNKPRHPVYLGLRDKRDM